MPTASNGGPATPAQTAPEPTESSTTRNRNRRRGNLPNNAQRVTDPRFEGREPTLKVHVYDYTGERNPEQWIRTTKEIATYVGRTYKKYTADFTEAIQTLVLTDPNVPDAPDPTDVADFEVWKLDIRDHRAKAQ